jgi:hypothetical protein
VLSLVITTFLALPSAYPDERVGKSLSYVP